MVEWLLRYHSFICSLFFLFDFSLSFSVFLLTFELHRMHSLRCFAHTDFRRIGFHLFFCSLFPLYTIWIRENQTFFHVYQTPSDRERTSLISILYTYIGIAIYFISDSEKKMKIDWDKNWTKQKSTNFKWSTNEKIVLWISVTIFAVKTNDEKYIYRKSNLFSRADVRGCIYERETHEQINDRRKKYFIFPIDYFMWYYISSNYFLFLSLFGFFNRFRSKNTLEKQCAV